MTRTSWTVALLSIAVLISSPVFGALVITYPTNAAKVPDEVVELSGTGADPDGLLEVSVFTNDWYPQTGTGVIEADGTWSYGPCNLKGKKPHHKHTIRVSVFKGGKRVSSVTVRGVVVDPAAGTNGN